MLVRNGKPCEDCIDTNLLPSLIHKCYRGSLLATAAISWQITRNRLTNTYQKVNKYIVLTEFAASRYIKAGFPPDKIVVKPNFLPSRSIISTNSGVRYAVYVGRLSEEKGVRTLLNAWKKINKMPLKILGDGPLRNELEQFVEDNNLNIEFLGFIENDQVLKIIESALFQVIPSECYEGFPMVVLEAYALGVPIIASRIGSLEEVVLEGKTGLTFIPADDVDLAEKVHYLIENDSLRAKMKENARLLFNKKYTAEANYKMLHSIYEQVIQENKGVN
jgi:glycosyltransferase involved in cell wall biosynthesis